MKRAASGLVLLAVMLVPAAGASGGVFKLTNGGEIRGELVNQDQQPRTSYVIRPFAGGEITLAAAQVKEVQTLRPTAVEYEKKRLAVPDTVEGHWEMAEWCRTQNLTTERKVHLDRVIELAPNHRKARLARGHKFDDATKTWQTKKPDRVVMMDGQRIAKKAKEVIEASEARKAAEREWRKKLKIWIRWAHGRKRLEAKEKIGGIDDPNAVRAIVYYLDKERIPQVKQWLAEALARIGSTRAVKKLVDEMLDDRNARFRGYCLELIEKHKPPAAVDALIGRLERHKKLSALSDNARINRMAKGLKYLGDKRAVEPLIDKLVTVHWVKLNNQKPGQLNPQFARPANAFGKNDDWSRLKPDAGQGPINFAPGGSGGPKVKKIKRNNSSVLEALVELTGENFRYDQDAWRKWHQGQGMPNRFKGRRG